MRKAIGKTRKRLMGVNKKAHDAHQKSVLSIEKKNSKNVKRRELRIAARLRRKHNDVSYMPSEAAESNTQEAMPAEATHPSREPDSPVHISPNGPLHREN